MPTINIEKLDTARIARILATALEEFAEQSFSHASFNQIIKRCGISKGTMYYYFSSKGGPHHTLIAACWRDIKPLLQLPDTQPQSASELLGTHDLPSQTDSEALAKEACWAVF